MKKYSILIPAYNAEKYIEDTLKRILAQTYEDFEVIVANDGSTDNTERICNEISKKDERIKVFSKKNEGLMLTRFYLYQKATGKYCICCDADDLWEKNTLYIVDKYIMEYQPDMLMFSYNLWEANVNKIKFKKISVNAPKVYNHDNFTELWTMLLCTDEINSLWSKVILKEKIPKEWNIPIVSHGEDKLQLIEIVKNVNKVIYVPDRLYNYRIDNYSMTRKFNTEYFEDVIKTVEVVWDTLVIRDLVSRDTINKFGCNVLELVIAYLDGIHRADIPNEMKKKKVNKYLNEHIIRQTIDEMDYHNISMWHRIMLFLVKQKYVRLINIIYDLNHILKGRK